MFLTIPSIVGIAIVILALFVLALDIFILFIMWKGQLLSSSSSSIYILAFANIVCNCIQASITGLYLGPSVVLQMQLFEPTSTLNRLLSYIMLAAWYADMQLSAIIAINRLCIIVFYNRLGKLFTRKIVLALAILFFISGFLVAIISVKVLPCCAPLFDYTSYWESFFDKGAPYNDWVDIPQNTVPAAISLTCYTIIWFYVRHTNKKLNPQFNTNLAEERRKKEVRYAIQFAALSFFAIAAWAGMRILPPYLPFGNVYPEVPFAIIIHSSVNSLIFLTINKEIKKSIKDVFFKTETSNTVVFTNSAGHQNAAHPR